jgi:hypothetical protein
MNDDYRVVTKKNHSIRKTIYFSRKINKRTFERSITQRIAAIPNAHKPVITKIG